MKHSHKLRPHAILIRRGVWDHDQQNIKGEVDQPDLNMAACAQECK